MAYDEGLAQRLRDGRRMLRFLVWPTTNLLIFQIVTRLFLDLITSSLTASSPVFSARAPRWSFRQTKCDASFWSICLDIDDLQRPHLHDSVAREDAVDQQRGGRAVERGSIHPRLLRQGDRFPDAVSVIS